MLTGIEEDSRRLATLALAEDGERDLTTESTVDAGLTAGGRIEFRNAGILAGVVYAEAVARTCRCLLQWMREEGARVTEGEPVATVQGNLRSLLRAERPLLNLLQRASGIATLTRQYVDAVAGTPCRVLHTRKTAPGLRLFDISAVLAGGGFLHRTDLSTVVMVKDNHWKALEQQGRTLEAAAREARALGATVILVEVENERQVALACEAGADRLMIDNQPPALVQRWGGYARSRRPGIEIEATGGITLSNARAFADAGADFISIGGLTHSVTAADISLELV